MITYKTCGTIAKVLFIMAIALFMIAKHFAPITETHAIEFAATFLGLLMHSLFFWSFSLQKRDLDLRV